MSSSVDNDDDEETDILLYVNHRAGGSNIRKLDELAGKLSLSTTGQEVRRCVCSKGSIVVRCRLTK